MGDLFSTASGAVGVISLGLQVCGQLVKYCQAYKGFGDDIQRLGNRADSLRMPLERLKELIVESRSSDPEFATDLEEKAMHLKESVLKLKTKVASCEPVLKDFRSRVRSQMNKATHVFRTEILNGMENDLNAIQQTIDTALSIKTFQKISRIEAMQENMFKLVEDLVRISIYPSIQTATDSLVQHVSMNQISTRQLPPPSFQAEQIKLITAAANMESQIEREIQTTDMSWPADHSWTMAFRRNRKRDEKKHRQKSFQYFSRLLNLCLYASFSASTGTGGFSLAPMLKIQAVRTRRVESTIYNITAAIWYMIPSPLISKIFDVTIHEFQVAFSKGEASPSDVTHSSKLISLLDSMSVVPDMGVIRSMRLGLYRIIRFLGECGSIPDNCLRNGILGSMCMTSLWKEEDWPIVCYLLDLGGPLKGDFPERMTQKRNMQFIMSKDEDGVLCPSIISIILRESAEELRSILEAKRIEPGDKVEGFSISKLLDLAIGWPQGIKTLLEFGADPSQITWSLIDCSEPEIGPFEVSVKILLDAGAKVGPELLQTGSPVWKSLVLQSVVKRRKTLWEWAQSYLLPEQIAKFDKSEDRIIDLQVGELHELLKRLGRSIPSSLQEMRGWRPGQSVYHTWGHLNSTDILDELYAYGFRDIDSVDYDGVTPSMTFWRSETAKWAWLVSKGANRNRKLPYSNATVAHLWSASIMQDLFFTLHEWEDFRSKRLQIWERNVVKAGGSSVFLLPANQDECVCPCSPGGCTTLSVSLRCFPWDIISFPRLGQKYPFTIGISERLKEPEFRRVSNRGLFHRILGILMDHSKGIPEAERITIRAMTFEGLGLKHACCIELKSFRRDVCGMKGRSGHEVNEILDEEKNRYEELEDLVLEFETAFTELGLPIWEFLTRHWQPRMIKHLSHRDPYDKEHHEGTRKIGVNLEVDDSDIPRWIHMLGDQIEEMDDEDS